MKKKLFFLIMAVSIWSCNRQNDIYPIQNKPSTNGGKIKTQSGGDSKWDLLGYGVDVTGDLLSASSVSDAPIFDIDRFANDYRSRIDVNTTTEGTEQYFGGASAYEYIRDVSKGKSIDGAGHVNYEGSEDQKKDGGLLNFTASTGKNSNDENKTSFSSRYSYATYEVSERVKRIRFTGDVTTASLMQYLTPEFLNNVATLSADALVARYGTHIMLDISIGGRLKFNYSGAQFKEMDYTKRTQKVKWGLGVSVLKIAGININGDKSTEEITQATTETSDKEYTLKYYGGTNSGRSISIDKDGNSSETINIASWQQSVNATNAALLEVGNALYLYDFITDPTKKSQVKAVITQHIKDGQPILAAQQIYEFYTAKLGRHAYNINPNMHLQYLNDGWHPSAMSFRAFPYSYSNAVPIYQFLNTQLNDRVLWPNPNPGWAGYRQDGILFYAYTTNIAGTVPIYSFRMVGVSGKGDHYYSTNKTPYDSLWTNDGVAFYAFPNQ